MGTVDGFASASPRRRFPEDPPAEKRSVDRRVRETASVSHGFRLFEVTLHHGMKQAVVPFVSKGTDEWNLVESIADLWKKHQGVTLHGLPRLTAEDVPDDGAGDQTETDDGPPAPTPKPVFRVEQTGYVGAHPYVEVYQGRAAGHTKAIPLEETEGPDADISGHAPARLYLAYLLATTNSERAVLAVESYGRACPVEPVVRWLNRWLMDANRPGSGRPWRLRIRPLGDDETLKGVIKQSKSTQLVLEKHELSGRQSQDLEMRVTAPIRAGDLAERARSTVRGWFEKDVGGTAPERVSKQQAIRDVAALIGEEIAGIDFDDAWIVVEDEYGAVKKVSPDRMSDVFTYKVTEWVRPASEDLQRAIRNAVLKIARSRELGIDWTQW